MFFHAITVGQGIALASPSALPGASSIWVIGTDGSASYQPLSSFLQTETDPVFLASAAAGISSQDIAGWDTTKTDFESHVLDDNPHNITKADIQLGNVVNADQTNASNLSSGTIDPSLLPSIAITEYLGSVANESSMLLLSGEKGDWCIRTDTSTVWVVTGDTPSSIGSWTELEYPTAPVTSVAGKTGIVTLVATDIVSGTFADARISESSVTQHQSALSIDWTQLVSLPSSFTPSAHTHPSTDITSDLLWSQITSENGFNCLSIERQSMTVLESAGTVYLDVEAVGGGDITWITASGDQVLDCSTGSGVGGKARVALTSGTDTVPVLNYLYVDFAGGVATLRSSTSFPSGEFAWIGTCVLRSAATTATDGPYALQRHSEDLQRDSGRGRLSYVSERLRRVGASWDSGCSVTVTDNAGSVTLAVSSGVVYQLHRQTFSAIADPAEINILNHSTTPHVEITDLASITEISDGTSWGNRTYIGVRIYGYVASGDSGVSRLLLNLPSGQYASGEEAIHDSAGYDIDSVSEDVRGGVFSLARVVLYKNQSGTVSVHEEQDLRGSIVGAGRAGGGGGTAQEFSDASFKIYDNDDATKQLNFQLSTIATGTTRTITIPDENVDLGSKLDDVVDDTTPQLGGDLDCNGHSVSFTQKTLTPATGNSHAVTVDLSQGNHWLIDMTSATAGTTVTINAPPGPSAGVIKVKHHGTTPQDITWSAGTGVTAIEWYGTEPTWNDSANAGENQAVSWEFVDGANIGLASTSTT